MINNFLLLFLVSISLADETGAVVFKNLRSGYQVSYPANWYPVSSDEPDEVTREDIPPDKSDYVTFYLNEKDRKNCKYKSACNISIINMSDGTAAGYKKSTEYIVRFRKNEKISSVQKSSLNGYKFEIDFRPIGLTEVSTNLYLFCEDSKQIVNFAIKRKRDSNFDKYTNQDKLVDLANVYNREQLAIVNSFKCPEKNFKFKKSKK